MSKHLTQGWALSCSEIAGEEAFHHQFGSSTPAGGWMHTLLFWLERSHQRRQLGELAELNDHLLRDIGVSQDEALREAAKPFWR